jgi:hypothetical protein
MRSPKWIRVAVTQGTSHTPGAADDTTKQRNEFRKPQGMRGVLWVSFR